MAFWKFLLSIVLAGVCGKPTAAKAAKPGLQRKPQKANAGLRLLERAHNGGDELHLNLLPLKLLEMRRQTRTDGHGKCSDDPLLPRSLFSSLRQLVCEMRAMARFLYRYPALGTTRAGHSSHSGAPSCSHRGLGAGLLPRKPPLQCPMSICACFWASPDTQESSL
ncbi:hypothetical protein BBK36DRAFT_1139048 [Trichoderma citrinoviride]|uniref:Uncharacterized protein n=1 Tax=Trichoderma citrinoviride TaxID=58853 RepID=A0A2T4BI31_9HYPO|nr:hypothetical protein BBK36DRAFT_1139048 [Trichoderma citrinoviride]PTB68960.1 hypothetical protein BBK36DRAFT_1139048 [Trichoderma citrinoviride]